MTTPLQLEGGDDHHQHGELVVRSKQRAVNMNYLSSSAAPPPQEPDDLLFVVQYLRILWNHRYFLLASLMLGALLGLIVTLNTTPMYQAGTTMEIQNVPEPFSAGGLLTAQADPALTTQSQLMSSRSMRQRVSEKIAKKSVPQLPEVSEPLAGLREVLGLTPPIKKATWRDAIGVASGSVIVTPSKDSRILNITSRSPNPQAAADFINTLAQEYIDRTQEERWESYQNTNAMLTRAQAEMKAKVEESERQVADFVRSKKLLITSKTDNISEDKLKQLGSAVASASADRITKQSIYESSLSSPTEALPEVLDNGPMAGYQSKISDLRRQMAELSTTLTPQHYRVKQIQAQIDELETARQRERTNVLSRIRIEYEASLKRESQLKHDFETQYGVLAGQADDLIQYNILLREAEGNKRLYETTLQQGKEASLASVMRTSNARVVDAARPSGVPYTPNVQFNLTLGMLGTLMCGVLFVVVRSRSDLRIQVPGVLGTQLNLRELGIIPAAKTDPAVRTLPRSGSRRDGNILLPRPDGLTDGLELVTLKRKPSIMAEAFRATMASIMFSGEHEKPSVLLFTSPSPREGKSTIVCNLAIAFAEIHNRVLLIDGDMRLPRLHKVFNIPNTSGLSDILHERGAIEDYVDQALSRKTSIPDLEVLPAGPARTNLSQLLYSSRMTELIRRLRRSFDIILIDSPPVLSVPDARILARNADAVILVARAHQTQQEAAIAAARCFAEDGRRILGTILNDWNPNVSAYGQYGFYGAYAAYGASNDSPYYPEDHS